MILCTFVHPRMAQEEKQRKMAAAADTTDAGNLIRYHAENWSGGRFAAEGIRLLLILVEFYRLGDRKWLGYGRAQGVAACSDVRAGQGPSGRNVGAARMSPAEGGQSQWILRKLDARLGEEGGRVTGDLFGGDGGCSQAERGPQARAGFEKDFGGEAWARPGCSGMVGASRSLVSVAIVVMCMMAPSGELDGGGALKRVGAAELPRVGLLQAPDTRQRPAAADPTRAPADGRGDSPQTAVLTAEAERERERNKVLRTSFASGFITGACSKAAKQLILHPLDTLKTRMQQRRGTGKSVVTGWDGNYTSARSVVRDVYRGWVPEVLCGGPTAATFFGVNEYVRLLLPEYGVTGAAGTLLAAAVGSTAGWTVRTPFEVVKTCVQGREYDNAWAGLRGIVARGGARELWVPLPRFLVLYLPGDPIKMWTYTSSNAAMAALQGGVLLGWQQSMSGSLAYAVVTVLSNPVSVANTRMILEPGTHESLGKCLGAIWRDEGVAGWCRGLTPRLFKAVVSGAVTFGIYEVVKAFVSANL